MEWPLSVDSNGIQAGRTSSSYHCDFLFVALITFDHFSKTLTPAQPVVTLQCKSYEHLATMTLQSIMMNM